ncbi:MAG TPA: peroxiredoxin [Phycisphaeraceae bacterium]|nr:peroxiredoxin [Phycisphaeraceae bacterium]
MIEPGRKARAFRARDQHGETHTLKDYHGHWLVLYFYPRDNTPGCTKEACQFNDLLKDIQKLGAKVLGVSPDSEKSHLKFADKFNLSFPLLADQRNKDDEPRICKAYGVWQEKKNYGKTYMGIVRTTYIIDPEGRVAHRFDRVKADGHAEKVLHKLNELMAQPA